MCVFSCVSLHLGQAFCIMSCHDLFLCCCCSFLTCRNSLLFYFIRYIIGNIFVVVLSVYVCASLHLSAIFVRLSAPCHIATCFFVVVVHFSLVTTLFCFISLDTLLGNFFVVVLSAYMCVFLPLSASW